jgi:hypothetical protein
MELLDKEKNGDVAKYIVAYLLLAITAAVAALATSQLRLSSLIVVSAFTRDSRWLRLAAVVAWILPLIAWGAYVLFLAHAYREAVTLARIRSARMHPGVEEPKVAFFRFLRRFDLDMLGTVFLKSFAGTFIVFLLLLGLRHLLMALVLG